MEIVLKGIHKVKKRMADGSTRTYYYAWRGGPRLKAEPHSKAFMAEYLTHVKADMYEENTQYLEGLISYLTGTKERPNPDWEKLAAKTRKDYLHAFDIIKKTWPKLPVRVTQARGMKREIREWHRSFAANPRTADHMLVSLSKIFSYAVQNELIEKNPCTGIEKMYKANRRNCVWSSAQIALFRQSAPQHVLNVFEAALYTGQRQGDLLRLKWSDYDGTHLRVQQGKTGARVKILVHPYLRGIFDSLPRDSVFMLANSRGRPWTSDGFRTAFGKAQKQAGIEEVTFHDLRGTFITERRKEGSTVDEIKAISGHSRSEINSTLDKHYLADDQGLGDAVILRMNENRK